MRLPQSVSRRPLSLLIGILLMACMILAAIIGKLFFQNSANEVSPDLRAPASADHLLGTDSLGRDVLSRTLAAAGPTLIMSLIGTVVAIGVGVGLGTALVVVGRRIEGVGARAIDLMVSFPPVIIAIAVVAIMTPSRTSVVVGVGIAFSPQFARLSNTLARSVRSKDYVVTAELLGIGRTKVLVRHIIPNVAPPLLVLGSVCFATVIVTISGLSFIGLGVQPPAYDWGQLLASGLRDLYTNPIVALGPSAGILLTGLAAGLIGDGLAEASSTHRRAKRKASRRSGTHRTMHEVSETRPGANADGADPRSGSDGEHVVCAVTDLRVWQGAEYGAYPIVRGVRLAIHEGEVVGILGESGCGKSVTAMAMSRLLHPSLNWSAAHLEIAGHAVTDAEKEPPRSLATELGMVFQDPSACFNPALHIGSQITETSRLHMHVSRRDARKNAVEWLQRVRISSPEQRMDQYPHELSGGMKQRAMIAMAMMASPKLLIADEPTTALDVTVQADVLRLLTKFRREENLAILLISHDINVVAAVSDRVCVMYAGRIVEEMNVSRLREGRARHPYSQGLLESSSGMDQGGELAVLDGRPPQPTELTGGCAFAPRCPLAMPVCFEKDPELTEYGAGESVACHAINPDHAVGVGSGR